jgi:hypothetical protein
VSNLRAAANGPATLATEQVRMCTMPFFGGSMLRIGNDKELRIGQSSSEGEVDASARISYQFSNVPRY